MIDLQGLHDLAADAQEYADDLADEFAYASGFHEANYPVPALPMDVVFFHDAVAVFEWRGDVVTEDTCECVFAYPTYHQQAEKGV